MLKLNIPLSLFVKEFVSALFRLLKQNYPPMPDGTHLATRSEVTTYSTVFTMFCLSADFQLPFDSAIFYFVPSFKFSPPDPTSADNPYAPQHLATFQSLGLLPV